MSFDEILDLTADVFSFYNMMYAQEHRHQNTNGKKNEKKTQKISEIPQGYAGGFCEGKPFWSSHFSQYFRVK